MPSIGGIEMLIIAIVAIVVVGPKDLPKLLRGFGNFTRQIRSMAGDFQNSIDDFLISTHLFERTRLTEGMTQFDDVLLMWYDKYDDERLLTVAVYATVIDVF